MPKADRTSITSADPIFAAIERHRAAARVWAAAVKVRDASPDGANEQQAQLDEAVANARLPLVDAGLDLIGTEPTTPEGVVAALEYARDQLLDGGIAMPQAVPWLDHLVGTLADAAADLLAKTPKEDQPMDELNTTTDQIRAAIDKPGVFVLPTGILQEDAVIIDNQEDHIVLTLRVSKDLIRDNHSLLMALLEIATRRPAEPENGDLDDAE